MEFLMSNKKSLVIVEGEKAEYGFFRCIGNCFGMEMVIFPIKDNMYVLYKKLKQDGFNVDIKSLLAEMFPEGKDILSETYAFTYLVFDLDPHHTENHDLRDYEEIINENVEHALEMTEYFRDETDPTVGRIYINYPMFESFRYCNSTFDEEYRDGFIKIGDIRIFKLLASQKKLASKHIDRYRNDDYYSLFKMNLYKLNYLFYGMWDSIDYNQYLIISQPSNILRKQQEEIRVYKQIAVLNTSLYLVIDYFGNRDGFYEKICKLAPGIVS